MRSRHIVSMAVTVLQGDPEALLCERPDCPDCALARKFTAPQATGERLF